MCVQALLSCEDTHSDTAFNICSTQVAAVVSRRQAGKEGGQETSTHSSSDSSTSVASSSESDGSDSSSYSRNSRRRSSGVVREGIGGTSRTEERGRPTISPVEEMALSMGVPPERILCPATAKEVCVIKKGTPHALWSAYFCVI